MADHVDQFPRPYLLTGVAGRYFGGWLARGVMRPDISFVLPAHNEAENVGPMVSALIRIASPLGSYQIVFVDDGSTDEPLANVKARAWRNPAVTYVAFTRNFGHQAALRAGLLHAQGRAVVLMDCDFEHPPELVPALVTEWRRGAKVVTTHRLDINSPASFGKRVTSRLFYNVLDLIGDVRIEPGSADFLLLDRVVVDTINGFSDQDLFVRGLVRWLGFPMARVPYAQGVRQSGESKFKFRRMVDFAITGIVAHSIRPLR